MFNTQTWRIRLNDLGRAVSKRKFDQTLRQPLHPEIPVLIIKIPSATEADGDDEFFPYVSLSFTRPDCTES